MAPIAGMYHTPVFNPGAKQRIQLMNPMTETYMSDVLLMYLLPFHPETSVPLWQLEHLSLYGKGFLWIAHLLYGYHTYIQVLVCMSYKWSLLWAFWP